MKTRQCFEFLQSHTRHINWAPARHNEVSTMPNSKPKPAPGGKTKIENLPSKTGEKSGKNRGNAEPKKK